MSRTFLDDILDQIYEALYYLKYRAGNRPEIRVSFDKGIVTFESESTKFIPDGYDNLKKKCYQHDISTTPADKLNKFSYRNKDIELDLTSLFSNRVYDNNNMFYMIYDDVMVERLSDGMSKFKDHEYHYKVTMKIKKINYISYLDELPEELHALIFIKSKLKATTKIINVFNRIRNEGIQTSLISKSFFILAYPDLYKDIITYDLVSIVEKLDHTWQTLYNNIVGMKIIPRVESYGHISYIISDWVLSFTVDELNRIEYSDVIDK